MPRPESLAKRNLRELKGSERGREREKALDRLIKLNFLASQKGERDRSSLNAQIEFSICSTPTHSASAKWNYRRRVFSLLLAHSLHYKHDRLAADKHCPLSCAEPSN